MAWHGNGYAYKGVEVSDGRGYPTRLPLLPPERIDWDGSKYIYNTTPTPEDIEPGDMFHAAVMPRAGYRLGRGILDRYQSTLKLMVVTEKAQYVLMKDGKPMGILSLGLDVTPEEAKEYKEGFMAAVKESGVAAIGNADFKPVQWSSADLAMIPTREFNLRLASDITGVPPYLLGVPSESRVYANMETEWANFIRVTLGRYLAPLEHVLSTCFPRGKTVHFSTDQLLRSDAAARWAVYKQGDEIGAITRDEIREMERLPPLTDAQKAELDSKTAPAPAPAPAVQPDPTQEDANANV
jgi:HK97 family phage portal protein